MIHNLIFIIFNFHFIFKYNIISLLVLGLSGLPENSRKHLFFYILSLLELGSIAGISTILFIRIPNSSLLSAPGSARHT